MSSVNSKIAKNMETLSENPYPGRGLVIGRMGETAAVQVYWLMGRSENSRNRVLVQEGDTVRTAPFDAAKVQDPSLIIYNAMRTSELLLRFKTWTEEEESGERWSRTDSCSGNMHIVSNGNQTDTMIKSLDKNNDGLTLGLSSRTYEPDAPNYTPRISASVETGRLPNEYMISIIRRGNSGEAVHQFHHGLIDEIIKVSTGLCVHTYLGDGEPLPSFDRDPYLVEVGADVDETAEMYWDRLNPDNRVALVAKGIDISTGEVKYKIINKHGNQPLGQEKSPTAL